MMQKRVEHKRNERELDLHDTASVHGKCLCENKYDGKNNNNNNGNWYHWCLYHTSIKCSNEASSILKLE